jgi:hypothetical protein
VKQYLVAVGFYVDLGIDTGIFAPYVLFIIPRFVSKCIILFILAVEYSWKPRIKLFKNYDLNW